MIVKAAGADETRSVPTKRNKTILPSLFYFNAHKH